MKKVAMFILVFGMCIMSLESSAQTINSVYMKFTTTNDDKDGDSFIRFQLQSANGSWLASQEGTFGGSFPDGSVYTFQLNMGQPDYPESMLANTFLYMYMATVGNDTWNFQWEMVVYLSDGRKRVANGTGGLSEDRQSFKLGPLF
jgi:hypothetical protein